MATKLIFIIFCCLLLNINSVISQNYTFPAGFKLGTATAAYQVEGGWNADGKGENIWDRLVHTHPELMANNETGDVACDSYHLYKEDVSILKDMGVDHYRFSLSWSRILPNGFSNNVNPAGIEYYNNLINELIANGIEPLVTLYHWDLPQILQELGGWTNPQTAVYFEDFARVAFENFGDRVKNWITINEPQSICVGAYEWDGGAPADVKTPGIGLYLCGKTILLAHAKAYRLYNSTFKDKQNGRVGITIDTIWFEPKTNETEDIDAAEREIQMRFGWWAHPIFSTEGDYPEVMKTRINEISKAEGFAESRLPPLSAEEVELIRGTADFFGLNHYFTLTVNNQEFPINATTSYAKDKGTGLTQIPDWEPSGFRKLFNWVKKEYNNPLVIVTENGYGTGADIEDDNDRITYLREFLKALITAVKEDGCNIQGYTVWSILDNLEWRAAYTIKFGLYHVDFSSPNRTRTPKPSAAFYKSIISTRTVPEN